MNRLTLESLMGKRVLLLSPHADDVAYSIGGIVALLCMHTELLLITIFGRSGWALQEALRRQSIHSVSALREREDRDYCDRRRIDYSLLPCPDSFAMGYDEEKELRIAADNDPRTTDTVNLIMDSVTRRMPHFVIAPCSVGGHIDHQIVRNAAQGLNQFEVLYYEDIPYSARLPLAELDTHLIGQGLVPAMTIDIESVLEGKCADMWGYRSQTSVLTIAEMLLHACRIGGYKGQYAERLWHHAN